MTTTIHLDDHLLAEVKRLAIAQGSSVDEFIATALRDAVSKSQPAKSPIALPVFDKGLLQPGVDLNNNAAVRCLLDDGDAPAGR